MQRLWAAVLLASLELGCSALGSSGPTQASLQPTAKLLPARTRRLTNLEVERSVAALTGLPVSLATELPPDVRQEGYTPNANQDVSTAWATRYSALVRELAERAAVQKTVKLAACPELSAQVCRADRVKELGLRAFRRPLESGEVYELSGLLEESARAGEPAEAGVALLLRALLESPSFLYVTELGQGGPTGARVRLDDFELASEISYLVRGAPPDIELLAVAAAGRLQNGGERRQQAERLL